MSNSINTNIAAYYAQQNITAASTQAQSSVARLSSGSAIVQASDNVAALAIGNSLGSQVAALNTASTNASQGSSLLQVADGALAQIGSILNQQNSIALQAASGSLTNTDRGFLNQQFVALTNEINALATGTTFNGVQLIDGSIAQGGSTSSNPLQNVGLVSKDTQLTIGGGVSGFTDLTGALNQSKAGTTYQTGAVVGSATTFTAATSFNQPTGSYDKSLYGTLSGGGYSATAVGAVGSITGYNVNFTAGDGTVYTGVLAANGTTGVVAGGTSLTLTATTNAASHATISLTTGATGFAGASDNSIVIAAGLKSNFGPVAFASGTFAAAPTITQPTGDAGLLADASLRGDLSQGAFTVQLTTSTASVANGVAGVTTDPTAAKGYLISYTLNGQKYQGTLANNDGAAGHNTVASAATLVLKAVTDNAGTTDLVNHASLTFTTNTQFGATLTASAPDQSTNILSALQANVAGATALNTTKSATVTGEAAQAGIGLVSATSNPTKNDLAFSGDLSKGVFSVTGSAGAGYSVSYALNGTTYQGNLSSSEVSNGGTLVLDNGSGSLAFSITASSIASPNASTASSTALTAAFTNQFAAATAHASHLISNTLASDGNGGTIPGSAITAASTAGTILDGFDGSKAKLTSSLYGGSATNIPPISSFSATGSGATTVFSVNIGGTTYSTQGVVGAGSDATTGLAADTFDGSAGILNFYKNGDKTANPSEVLRLDLSNIGSSAKIGTTADVTAVVNALNSTFGGGGSSGTGGLQFQLGTTTTSNVTVNIGSAKSTALYANQALDISTQAGATAAATQISKAIDNVTSLRAGVGALESQFNFAAAALQTSTQNQTAAQGQFLDTDIAKESTKYATEQVKLQAGISVLAQANQQLQALLKLIA